MYTILFYFIFVLLGKCGLQQIWKLLHSVFTLSQLDVGDFRSKGRLCAQVSVICCPLWQLMSYFIFTLLCSLLVEKHICAAQLYCYSIGLRDLFSSSSIFYLISFSCLNLGYRLIWKRKLHVLTALVSRLFCTVKVLLILSANSVSCWKCKKFQYKYSKSEASWCENERSQTCSCKVENKA